MYKPPENKNRVKSIKSKFENIEKSISNGTKEETNNLSRTRDNMNICQSSSRLQESSPLNLQRQLSDPSKRNIKRTPAFRMDKNTEKVSAFHRSSVNDNHELKHISKHVCSSKTEGCDIKNSKTSEHNIVNNNVPFLIKNDKPVLYKSKSSIDFNVIRNKFNSGNTNEQHLCESNQRDEEGKKQNISALYTEPIPKSLRVKTCDKTIIKPIYSNLEDLTHEVMNFIDLKTSDIHNSSTLELTDKGKDKKKPINKCTNILTDRFHGGIPNGKLSEHDKKNVDSSSAMKKLDTLLEFTKTSSLKKANRSQQKSEQHLEHSSELSDTLKKALKKPLPTGPAPKKPPRIFTHTIQDNSVENTEKNSSFLYLKHKTIDVEKSLCSVDKSCVKRSDPKYMLNKLETALRNNKLRCKPKIRTDVSTTSGEDSDENVYVKNNFNFSATNKNRSLPSVPDNMRTKSYNTSPTSNSLLVQALNFNCLNNQSCVSSPYTKLNESKSSFFVSVKEEPVYAEPWHFEEGLKMQCEIRKRSASSDRNPRTNRNSLYYLSNPVLSSTPISSSSGSMNMISPKQTDVPSSNRICRSEKV
ncbi:hypothetical protein WA026_015942 [Henosepilachna vigintioctopunctata]|uniref:Exophilin 5 n=1 Tax=Henosepilachna vigintioctopunctata TaxID=420089 RepID=A0AAW1U8A4_9CUCU